jgi:hypothetical protein
MLALHCPKLKAGNTTYELEYSHIHLDMKRNKLPDEKLQRILTNRHGLRGYMRAKPQRGDWMERVRNSHVQMWDGLANSRRQTHSLVEGYVLEERRRVWQLLAEAKAKEANKVRMFAIAAPPLRRSARLAALSQ